MAKVVIKRRVNLDFLGDDYKEAYIIFKSIPLRELDDKIKQAQEAKDNESIKFITDTLKDKFIEGKFPDEQGKLFALSVDDLEDFDAGTVIKAFRLMTGQEVTENLETP